MAKTTVASLEAQLIAQQAAFDAQRADLEAAAVTNAETIAKLGQMVAGLTEAVTVLNGRLNLASEAFKTLRAEVVSLRSNEARGTQVGRMPVKPQPNLWFVALAQLRTELGLAESAFVDRDLVMARMAELKAAAQGSAA